MLRWFPGDLYVTNLLLLVKRSPEPTTGLFHHPIGFIMVQFVAKPPHFCHLAPEQRTPVLILVLVE